MKKHTCAGCVSEAVEPQAAQTPTPNPVLAPTPATPTPAPAVHKGIICDVCQETVVGVRHKCLDCPGMFLVSPLSLRPALISGVGRL
jgi:next-to-BRCA1 protein 1